MIFKLIILFFTCSKFVHSEVGTQCDNFDDTIGICREAQKCTWAVDLIKSRQKKPTDFARCGFRGSTPLICCKDEIPPPPNNIFLRKAAQACEKIKNLKVVDPPRVDYHIVGGEPVEPGEFPHQVAVGYSDLLDPDKVGYYCGGTLISRNFILTAAHCVNQRQRQPKVIRLGKSSLDLHEDDPYDGFAPIDIEVKEIIIHPNYSSRRRYDDIALIQLINPVTTYTKVLKPACLNIYPLPPSQLLTITGWGTVDIDTKATASWLMKANLTEVPLDECRSKYTLTGLNKLPENLRDTQLCATGKSASGQIADACQGDSGGPIQYKLPSQTNNLEHYYVIVGVTSFGASCGSNIPGVYTRVDKYLEWIESKVWPSTNVDV